jgi:oligopeptide/dipeptide ABC transporter ATP-binding protein
MRQRIHIAMALAARPTLLLADEPTTALDVIVQAEILRLLDRLRREEGMSLLLVSHDFRVVAGLCDRVGVMYAGELVEVSPTREILRHPEHPYTIGLMNSLPEAIAGGRLRSIPGSPPEVGRLPPGCAFAGRCLLATDTCAAAPIPLRELTPQHWSRCIRTDRLADLRRGLVTADSAGS